MISSVQISGDCSESALKADRQQKLSVGYTLHEDWQSFSNAITLYAIPERTCAEMFFTRRLITN